MTGASSRQPHHVLVVPPMKTILRPLVIALFFAATPVPLLAAAGDLDTGFNTPFVTSPYGLAVQPDGKIAVANRGSTAFREHCFRVKADGALDSVFSPSVNDRATCATIQGDGKVLFGGDFTSPGFRLTRYNADGTLDGGFSAVPEVGTLRGMAVQPDGRILIRRSMFNGVDERHQFARLNENGSLDISFRVADLDGPVWGVAVQPNGKIVIGGAFTTVGGLARSNVARLNADGTVDTAFDPNANGPVNAVTMLKFGQLILAGDFTTVGGVTRNRIARLNANGTLDATFNPNLNGPVQSTVLQADGKIIVAGSFTTIGGTTCRSLARLTYYGRLDTSFSGFSSDGSVSSLALQADGRVLIGGTFTVIGKTPRVSFARLLNDKATQTLSVPNIIQVSWYRNGTAPETHAVTFELSIDGGSSWTLLGAGRRGDGSWEKTGLNLPASGMIRARARTCGGYNNGSSGLVEQIVSFTGLIRAPLAITLPADTITPQSATLQATVRPRWGATKAHFEWGTDLSYGNTTLPQNIGPTGGSTLISAFLGEPGLRAHTTYHFRVVATNEIGTSYGDDMTFTTTNSTPEAGPDEMVIVANPTRTIHPLSNDWDRDGDTLTVTGATDGAKGTVSFTGDSVTYTATSLGAGTDTFEYTVSDGFGGSATGTVKVFSVASRSGLFAGLNYDVDGVAGGSQIAMGSMGALSGKFHLSGLTYSFKGQLDDTGAATIQLSRDDRAPVILRLALVPGETPYFYLEIEQQGTITASGWWERAGTNTLGKRRYTLLLPPDPMQAASGAFPQGTGFARVSLSSKGRIVIAGVTGDGAKFSTTSVLHAGNTFPFFATVHDRSQGEIHGHLIVRDMPGVSDLDGELEWNKRTPLLPQTSGQPVLTTAMIPAIGSLYVQPKPAIISEMLAYNATGDATVDLAGGNLTSPLSAPIHVRHLNPPTAAAPIIEMKFRLTNGVFVGSFMRPGLGRASFQGAVFQKQNCGAGYFLGTEKSGAVTLTPSP